MSALRLPNEAYICSPERSLDLLMPTLAAQHALLSMWPLIFKAGGGTLNNEEIQELRRLCDVMTQGVPGRSEFNRRALKLCSVIHSSALLESGRAEKVEPLLQEVDDLRRLLDGAPM